MSDRPNVPVPDELADVRSKIKALEARESELKLILITDPGTREGASWLAEIKTIKQQVTDWKELKAMHRDLVAEYTFPREIVRVELSGVTEDGELIPARRFRKEVEGTSQ